MVTETKTNNLLWQKKKLTLLFALNLPSVDDKDDKNVPESSIHHLQSTNNDVVVADEDEDFSVEFSLARLKSKNWKTRRNQVKNNIQDQSNDSKVDQREYSIDSTSFLLYALWAL